MSPIRLSTRARSSVDRRCRATEEIVDRVRAVEVTTMRQTSASRGSAGFAGDGRCGLAIVRPMAKIVKTRESEEVDRITTLLRSAQRSSFDPAGSGLEPSSGTRVRVVGGGGGRPFGDGVSRAGEPTSRSHYGQSARRGESESSPSAPGRHGVFRAMQSHRRVCRVGRSNRGARCSSSVRSRQGIGNIPATAVGAGRPTGGRGLP